MTNLDDSLKRLKCEHPTIENNRRFVQPFFDKLLALYNLWKQKDIPSYSRCTSLDPVLTDKLGAMSISRTCGFSGQRSCIKCSWILQAQGKKSRILWKWNKANRYKVKWRLKLFSGKMTKQAHSLTETTHALPILSKLLEWKFNLGMEYFWEVSSAKCRPWRTNKQKPTERNRAQYPQMVADVERPQQRDFEKWKDATHSKIKHGQRGEMCRGINWVEVEWWKLGSC